MQSPDRSWTRTYLLLAACWTIVVPVAIRSDHGRPARIEGAQRERHNHVPHLCSHHHGTLPHDLPGDCQDGHALPLLLAQCEGFSQLSVVSKGLVLLRIGLRGEILLLESGMRSQYTTGHPACRKAVCIATQTHACVFSIPQQQSLKASLPGKAAHLPFSAYRAPPQGVKILVHEIGTVDYRTYLFHQHLVRLLLLCKGSLKGCHQLLVLIVDEPGQR